MKKLFKLFPVALAAFALASCSSDDLSSITSEEELTVAPGQLLVQVEGEDDATTRGGFVTNIYDYKFYSAMFFNVGDKIKLYHNATSWKPETWSAVQYGQYKNSEGIVGVFKGDDDATIADDEEAYGIYPYTASVFGNEDRTSIQYDLSSMAFVDYSVDAIRTYTGTTGEGAITKAYAAEFPLWGVKTPAGAKMTMKHLAGILRLDVAKIALPTTGTDYRYVVIYSPTKKLTGIINTAADLLHPDPLTEALTPSEFMTTAPKLEVEATANPATIDNIPLTEAGAAAVDNVIVIRLDKNVADTHLMAFVPILEGIAADEVSVYITDVLPNTTTTVDLSAAESYPLSAEVINGCNDAYTVGGTQPHAGKTTVQRGVTYKINDDRSNQNTTAKTPWELAKGIIAADKAAYRDFEINFTLPIEVKNNDTAPQNFYLDLSGENTEYGLDGWDLMHNVTVNLTLTKSADATTEDAILYVKTKSNSSKKLTLNITNGTTPIDKIEFKEGELKSDVVLKTSASTQKLPNIVVNKNNEITATKESFLTIKAGTGTNTVTAKSTITIDAAIDEPIAEVILASGVAKLNLNNGTVSKISVSPSDKIVNDVTVSSTGTSQITTVDKANVPEWTTDRDKYGIYFTSAWNAETTITGVAAQAEVYTASQLAALTAGTIAAHLNADIDLTANTAWASLPLTANFTGINKNTNVYTNNTTAKDIIYPTITGLSNPLFNTMSGALTISNFKLSTVNITSTWVSQGALAKELNATGNCTIDNVDADGVTIDASGKSAIGGLIGLVSSSAAANTVDIINVDVNNVSLKGNRQMGGIIGQVSTGSTSPKLSIGATNAAITGGGFKVANAKFCSATNVSFELTETPLVIYDPEYASLGLFVGQFFKSTAADFNMVVNGTTLPTFNDPTGAAADNSQNLYSQRAKYGVSVDGKTIYYDVVMGQKLTGYAAKSNSPKATIYTVSTADPTNFVKTEYSAYATAPAVVPAAYLYYVNE